MFNEKKQFNKNIDNYGINEKPEDFSKLAKITFDHLDALKNKKRELKTLGTFEAVSSKEKEIIINTFIWEESGDFISEKEKNESNKFLQKQNINMSARLLVTTVDKDTSKIIGIRLMDIGKNSDESFSTRGDINIRLRGQGLASVLDTFLEKVFQKFSNQNKKNIKWIIENENLITLNKIKEELTRSNISDEVKNQLKSKVVEKELEQKRWQKLYGLNGKFNFNKIEDQNGFFSSKEIMPNDEEINENKVVSNSDYERLVKQIKECV